MRSHWKWGVSVDFHKNKVIDRPRSLHCWYVAQIHQVERGEIDKRKSSKVSKRGVDFGGRHRRRGAAENISREGIFWRGTDLRGARVQGMEPGCWGACGSARGEGKPCSSQSSSCWGFHQNTKLLSCKPAVVLCTDKQLLVLTCFLGCTTLLYQLSLRVQGEVAPAN